MPCLLPLPVWRGESTTTTTTNRAKTAKAILLTYPRRSIRLNNNLTPVSLRPNAPNMSGQPANNLTPEPSGRREPPHTTAGVWYGSGSASYASGPPMLGSSKVNSSQATARPGLTTAFVDSVSAAQEADTSVRRNQF